MRLVSTLPGRGRAAALALTLVLMLLSCTTWDIHDTLPPGSGKGWVTFVSDGLPSLTVERIGDGTADTAIAVRDTGDRAVAVACPPGRAGFLLRYPGGSLTLHVPVAEGRVTCAGILPSPFSGGPATAPRVSIGIHPLPLDARDGGPAPFVAALVDGDWATRLAAARALALLAPPLEPSAVPWLAVMAREDVSPAVRAAARDALAAGGRAVPPEPLAMTAFARDATGWPLGEGLASDASLVDEGYRLAVYDPGAAAWRFPGGAGELPAGGGYDVLLECRWVGGDADARYGLALGSGPSTFVAVAVSRGGLAVAERFGRGLRTATLLPATTAASPAITGTTVTRIEVRVRAERWAVLVNGEPAGSFAVPDADGFDRIGVFVDGAATVVARKIVIAQP